MDQKRIKYWRTEIETREQWLRVRCATWQRLIRAYDLKYEGRIRDLAEDQIVHVSRFYPVVRQIVASVAYQYPQVFVSIEEEDAAAQGDLLERAANAAIRLMGTKEEVRQMVVDALFCGRAYGKIGYNPPGDDAVAPYVANDALEEDFPYFSRIAPENMLPDLLTPPHNSKHARDWIEKMWCPLEFVLEDARFKGFLSKKDRDKLKPTTMADKDGMLQLLAPASMADEEKQAFLGAIENGEMVLLYEIHDRLHKRRIVFAEGLDEPIEDIDHPFARVEFQQKTSLFSGPMVDEDGQPVLDLENGEPAAGWIVEGGSPYVTLAFDSHPRHFVGEPLLRYLEDLQLLVVESVSRRADLLKRYARVGLVARAELAANPDLLTQLKRARDGEFVQTNDTATAVRELSWGNPPQDQLGLEADARSYEEQIANVRALSGKSNKTATSDSLDAASESLNREWMQDAVSNVFELVTRNALQIMGDPRYTPERFELNVAPEGSEPLRRALTYADFLFDFKVRVKAGSMSPLIEQLERDDYLQMYQYLRDNPRIDQVEMDKMLLNAFQQANPDKLLSEQVDEEAVRAAQLENRVIVTTGQDPGVLPGQDHQVHLEWHEQVQSDPAFATLMPAQQQQVMAVTEQHKAAHQQQMEALMPGQGPAPSSRAAPQAQTAATSVQGAVASNAQRMSGAVAAEGEGMRP